MNRWIRVSVQNGNRSPRTVNLEEGKPICDAVKIAGISLQRTSHRNGKANSRRKLITINGLVVSRDHPVRDGDMIIVKPSQAQLAALA